jgi:hypothetical protein
MACGAACGALAHCVACSPIPDPGKDASDYQMQYIINEVALPYHPSFEVCLALLFVLLFNIFVIAGLVYS